MFSRHWQRRDVHREAAIHVERPDQEETAARDDGFVFEEEPLEQPQSHEDQPVDLGHSERPRHSVDVIEELIGQRRADGFIRDSLVDDGDDHSRKHQVEQGVEESHARFPPLLGETIGPVFRYGDLDVIAVTSQPAAQGLDQTLLFEKPARFAVVLVLLEVCGAVRDTFGRVRRRRVHCGHVNFDGRTDVTVSLDQILSNHFE